MSFLSFVSGLLKKQVGGTIGSAGMKALNSTGAFQAATEVGGNLAKAGGIAQSGGLKAIAKGLPGTGGAGGAAPFLNGSVKGPDLGSIAKGSPVEGGAMGRMGGFEKMARTYGNLASMKNNPMGAMGAMGEIGDVWSGNGRPQVQRTPEEREAIDRSPYSGNAMRTLFQTAGSGNPVGSFFDSKDSQKRDHEKSTLRDYYTSVLKNRSY
jgi:hypothetical protein